MTCTVCSNPIAACNCSNRNERLVAAQGSPYVKMPLGQMLRAGDIVLYSEDGSSVRCEVVSNTSETGCDRFRLKVIEKLRPAYIGDCEYQAGDEFDIMQRTDCGAWGGMWSMELEVKR